LSQSLKSKGQYFTPLNIVQAIVKFTLKYVDKQISPFHVLDPATGEGIFSQEVLKLFRKDFDFIHVNAVDIDPVVIREAQSRILPLINSNHTVVFNNNNFLTESFQGEMKDTFDLIIGNPPHNAKYSVEEWDIIRRVEQEYIEGNIPSESALYFVLKSLLLLKKEGILSFILPKPFCYSNRWKPFRELCLTKLCLLAVFDLANQFYGQLQEQIVIILRKSPPSDDFLTGVWNQGNSEVQSLSRIRTSVARQADNFLVAITPNENRIIEKIYSECESIEWNAFRGLSSVYRTDKKGIPLIEKVTVSHGFLLPLRSFAEKETPQRLIKRLLQPKIICQRIISYSTQPTFRLFLPVFVDERGEYLTHETVTNIRPVLIDGIGIYSYGALLQSELFRWWLQYVVYTKNFVTSKDLDNPYLRKLVLPKFRLVINKKFRNKVLKNIKMIPYDVLLSEICDQSKLDQLFVIGELYKLYQKEGILVRDSLYELQENLCPKLNLRLDSELKRVKRLNWLLTRNRLEDINKILVHSLNTEKIMKSLVSHYSKKRKIQLVIDKIIYMMYDLSSKEQETISGGSYLE
jgi:hypothetical protein